MQERAGKWSRAAGLTLLEALVVVALLGVMVSLAAPGLSALRQQHQLQAAAEGLWSSLVLARSEALRRQQRVTVCARQAGQSEACGGGADWQQGWLVFADANDNASLDAGEQVLERHAAPPVGVQLIVSSTVSAYFSYNAQGRSATVHGAFMAGTWRFCRPDATAAWQLVGNALGRPRLEKSSAASCG